MKTKKLLSVLIATIVFFTTQNVTFMATASYADERWQWYKGVQQERCTYRVWHETYDRLGISLPTTWGNAGTWATNARNDGYRVDNNPTANSIVCWSKPEEWGHVAYVTGVDSSYIYIREAGFNPDSSYSGYWYRDTKYNISNQNRWNGYSLEGYIHLTSTIPTGSEMASGYDRVLPDGDYIIASAGTSDKSYYYYLDVPGTELPATSGTNVALWGPLINISSLDVWTISYSNGFYSIKQKGTNIALDLTGASTFQGANVEVYNANTSSAQKWAISKNGRNGYRIQAKCSGMSLDLNGGAATAGTNIQQWTNNDTDAQAWLFIPYKPAQPIDNGVYSLNSVLNSNLCLSPYSNSKNSKAIIKNYDSGNNSFNFIKLDNGYYKIVHYDTGFALGVKNGVSTIPSEIGIYTDNGSIAEQWAIIKENNGYVIISRCNGLALDVTGARAVEGTELTQYYYHGENNQIWQINCVKHTITYDANGGEFYSAGVAPTLVPITQKEYEITYGDNVTIKSFLPSNNTSGLIIIGGEQYIKKSGYKLIGWGVTSGKNTVKYSIGNAYAFNNNTVLYAVWNCIGDINGDEVLNNKDLLRLFKYLSKWDVEVNTEALDVSGDGKVNNKDLARLFKYLSGWNVEIY